MQTCLDRWVRQYLARHLAPLRSIKTDDLSPPARGLVYQLVRSLGCLANGTAAPQLREIDANDRRRLRIRGVKLGIGAIYVPAMLRPERRQLLAQLWRLHHPDGKDEVPEGGVASLPLASGATAELFAALGFVAVEANSWSEVIGDYSEGDLVSGWISKETDDGLILSLDEGVEALIPKHLVDKLEDANVGAIVKANIASIDSEAKRITVHPQ